MTRMLPPSAAGRPIPAPTVPQYRWPSGRAGVPARCGHCGARLLRGDVPTAAAPLVDVTCLACSRTACELVADGSRARRVP